MDTQRMLHEFCITHYPDILCIAEPFVSFDLIPSNFWFSWGLRLLASNSREGSLPNIWVLAAGIISLVCFLNWFKFAASVVKS